MKRSSAEARKEYDEMTAEELELELRKAFFCTDQIDGPLSEELERIREALDRKRPVEYLYTPEESWAQFRADHGDESGVLIVPQEEPETGEIQVRALRHRTVPALLRRVLIAAAVVVVLTGAALAADSLGLWAWAPRWNAAAGRYEPAAMEVSAEGPIPAALAELGITEPVYPSKLPEGFVITESHISEDPLVLMEQYARGNERLSITVTPVKGVKSAVYQKSGVAVRELCNGLKAHFVFENEETITAICFTKNYATFISGDLTLEAITEIILSIEAAPEGGGRS